MWQQVLALDAKYSAYRTPNQPQFRTVYLRRRSQLLRESEAASDRENVLQEKTADPTAARREYWKLRSQLLAQKYGVDLLEQRSTRSRSGSIRSSSRLSVENPGADFSARARRFLGSTPFYASLDVGGSGSRSSLGLLGRQTSSPLGAGGVVPTQAADASRALVGGKSIAENYAFAGMHHVFDQHSAAVNVIKFAHDDPSRLACCSDDGTLSICQVQPPPATVICLLKGHRAAVTDLCWSLSNDHILSVSKDGTSRMWQVASGRCIRILEEPCGVEINACAFFPLNNNMFVIGTSRAQIQVMNVSTGKCPKGGNKSTGGQVLCLSFDPAGQWLWTGHDKGQIASFLCNAATGKLIRGKRIVICEGHPITCMSCRTWASREARDPQLLVSCAVNSLCVFRISTKDGSLALKRQFDTWHKLAKIRSSFCPLMSFRQGACVVSGSEDFCVNFYDIERQSRTCFNRLQGHGAAVLDVCFNCDESLLASCDASGMVILWKREKK